MSGFGSSAASESSGTANGDFAPASATADSSMTGISGYASETTHIGGNAYGDFSREPQSMSERPGDAHVNFNISSNAYGDFGRVPPGSSMTERPGYAHTNPNIISNAHGDFGRAPPGSSMTERPGYAPVNTNINSNAHGDFVRAPQGPSMSERPGYAPVNTNISSNAHDDFGRVPPGPNSSNFPAMTTNDWSHQQHRTTGGPAYRPPGPIRPDGQKPFQIFVQSFADSKNYTFEVRATDTVEKLKGMIEAKIGIAKSQQRLDYQGKPLEDNMKLSCYDIHAQSTVQMNARVRGG